MSEDKIACLFREMSEEQQELVHLLAERKTLNAESKKLNSQFRSNLQQSKQFVNDLQSKRLIGWESLMYCNQISL
ncbi:MAG: hypothetical protein EOP42_22985 [Sphingobacteriaceae bacterium]|nr:MAG: hypothetical protein EOP42_22985 [Sphingobacteriaceae bacterium]